MKAKVRRPAGASALLTQQAAADEGCETVEKVLDYRIGRKGGLPSLHFYFSLTFISIVI